MVRAGQSLYKELSKHLPAPLWFSKGQTVGVCFLLTSACAVMLELVTVHSLFAVSPFPVDTRKRSSLSLSVPGTSAQAFCPDRDSPRHLLGWGTVTLTLGIALVMARGLV